VVQPSTSSQEPKNSHENNNSNIGSIELKYGGTSRNVSECITRLGYGRDLKFITSIGDKDDFGHLLLKCFDELGLRKDGIYFSDKYPTAVFCAVMDVHGGLEIGVNDMQCHLNLPISHLEKNTKDIQNAEVVLVDTNMNEDTVLLVLEKAINVKWTIVEPISAEKSKKILHKNILPMISILKPNDDQLDDLFNLFSHKYNVDTSSLDREKMSQEEQFVFKAKVLFDISDRISEEYGCVNKLVYVLVTCGPRGIRLITRNPLKHYHLPVKKIDDVVSANGAGDTFLGAFISGLLHYGSQDELSRISSAIRTASKCSAKTIMSSENISPEINPDIFADKS